MILRPDLSILICSLESREKMLRRLMTKLVTQNQRRPGAVEVLIEKDNGQKSIGNKRQSLLENSKGKYIVFIDDDDDIADIYVEKILTAIQSKPDCIGFRGRKKVGEEMLLFTNSLSIQEKEFINRQHFSHICHINPIRRDIATKFKFVDRFFEEDKMWLGPLLSSGLLKKEVFIDEEMYFYSPSGEDREKVLKDAMERKL